MDFGFIIGFDRPEFLWLLLIVPAIWYFSYNSLAGLGPWRRFFSLCLRTGVLLLVVAALSQMQWRLKTDSLTVLYLLDQSDSISATDKRLMLEYAYRQTELHRRENDKAGVIAFGADAKIEAAPFAGKLPFSGRIDTAGQINTGGTSIASALKIAQSAFPEGTARRVVIISDGNQNAGDALGIAQSMAESGIGIDVVPVNLLASNDVAVDKVDLPSNIRKGQTFEIRVSLTNKTQPGPDNPTGEVTGQLSITNNVISRNAKNGLLKQTVTLQPGKNLFSFTHKLERSAMYSLIADFEPDNVGDDVVSENNTASAFTHVRGKGKVLLIRDAARPDESDYLVDRLTASEIEVVVGQSSGAFQSPSDLLQYDTVILANVARASEQSDDQFDVDAFSDRQIEMLVDNCEHFGCGIVMIGGDRSFGAGGWSNSLLEKAMPVDFQIKNSKVAAVGALAMVMHGCEMANGNHWQIKVAEEAIKVLGPMDYCGVIDWSDYTAQPRWMWKFDKVNGGVDRVFGNRKKMLGLVSRMKTGDMMDFNAPMKTILSGLDKVDASIKHVIIISDGDPTQPTDKLLNEFLKRKIKISTCAIGTHGPAASATLKKISRVTGGKYYVVKKPSALPRIYQREARRVAKPVIFESQRGIGVIPTREFANHEILQGIDLSSMPPFLGYVMTTVKSNGLVERLAMADSPDQEGTEENRTLLATWRYGNGRTVCFTSDAGDRWTERWASTPQYQKLFSQMVRYSMRPITEKGNFTVASEVRDGQARITVTALDSNDDFLNFLDIYGSGLNGKEAVDLNFKQVGPGRYVADHKINAQGDWLFTVFPGKGYQRLMTGVSVPYSKEYADRESNLGILQSLASFEPRGGKRGKVTDVALEKTAMKELLGFNAFRPTLTSAISIEDIWPLLVTLCGAVFFADVFVRRVAVSFDGVGDLWRLIAGKFLSGETETQSSSMSRLQSRKAEIEKEIQSKRTAAKFTPDPQATTSGKQRLEEVIASEMEKTPAPLPKIERNVAPEEETSFTQRLLDAKKKARRDQDPKN
jgi:uncharacterized membrane protein/Mg-chelatase subunit ChlD